MRQRARYVVLCIVVLVLLIVTLVPAVPYHLTRPDISDFGFASDDLQFFGANATKTPVEELLLYPTTQSPYSFVASLQESAPLHWDALISASYSHFGIYFGTGAYVGVKLPCSVTEIPSGGLNITQYFAGLGCGTAKIESTSWMVVILSS